MKKFQSYDMDDALPVGAVEEGMEYGEDILPTPRNSEEQKKKGGWQNKEKRQPCDWELKGCKTIEDSAEKEKFKKELEKKERQRQYYAKWYAKQKEKKEQEKAEKEKKAPKKQEKLTLEDLPAAMEKMEEGAKLKAADIIMKNAAKDQAAGTAVPEDGTATAENGTAEEQNICDDALERLQKLREMAKNDDETESEAADLPDEAEAAEEEAAADTDGEEGGEDAAEDGREDSEMDADERIAERTEEMKESLACCGVEDSIPFVPRYYLELSASQAESLKEFIEDHLIDDIRNDPEVNNLDWIADMCEIWREMSKWHIKKSSD